MTSLQENNKKSYKSVYRTKLSIQYNTNFVNISTKYMSHVINRKVTLNRIWYEITLSK